MNITQINETLSQFARFQVISYESDRLTIKLEADGGPFEGAIDARLVFENVQVLHLPRIFHSPVALRELSAKDAASMVPVEHYDELDTMAKCLLIRRENADTPFYVYADLVRIEGIPLPSETVDGPPA